MNFLAVVSSLVLLALPTVGLANTYEFSAEKVVDSSAFSKLRYLFPANFQCENNNHQKYYDRLFEDGVLDISITFGFMDEYEYYARDGKLKKGSDGIMYQIVLNKFAQQFGVRIPSPLDWSNTNKSTLQFEAKIGDQKPVLVRIHFAHSSLLEEQKKGLSKEEAAQKQSEFSKRARDNYVNGMHDSDVSIYYGHARHSRGPDFGPIRFFNMEDSFFIGRRQLPIDMELDEIHTEIGLPFSKGHDFDKQILDPNKYQISLLLACEAVSYYKNLYLEKAKKFSGKSADSFDVLAYDYIIYPLGLEDELADFIGALLNRSCQKEIAFILNRMEGQRTAPLSYYVDGAIRAHQMLSDKTPEIKKSLAASDWMNAELKDRISKNLEKVATALDLPLTQNSLLSPNPHREKLLEALAKEMLRSNTDDRIQSDKIDLYKIDPVTPEQRVVLDEGLRELKRILNHNRQEIVPPPTMKLDPTKKPLRILLNQYVGFIDEMMRAEKNFYHQVMILRTDGRNNRKQYIDTKGLFDENL